jgi:hypothetical protein
MNAEASTRVIFAAFVSASFANASSKKHKLDMAQEILIKQNDLSIQTQNMFA